jgi:hypothetical protein
MKQYDRITELSITSIPADDFNETLRFLKQFPRLRYLHIHLANRQINDQCLLENIRTMIVLFDLLVYFKLQLDKRADSSVNWSMAMNERVKMYLIDKIFDGILMHFWF